MCCVDRLKSQSEADTRAILAKSSETLTDLSQPPSSDARMDNGREAFEFACALHLVRHVNRETAPMIVQAAEAGVIEIRKATDLLIRLSRQSSKRYRFCCC